MKIRNQKIRIELQRLSEMINNKVDEKIKLKEELEQEKNNELQIHQTIGRELMNECSNLNMKKVTY